MIDTATAISLPAQIATLETRLTRGADYLFNLESRRQTDTTAYRDALGLFISLESQYRAACDRHMGVTS